MHGSIVLELEQVKERRQQQMISFTGVLIWLIRHDSLDERLCHLFNFVFLTEQIRIVSVWSHFTLVYVLSLNRKLELPSSWTLKINCDDEQSPGGRNSRTILVRIIGIVCTENCCSNINDTTYIIFNIVPYFQYGTTISSIINNVYVSFYHFCDARSLFCVFSIGSRSCLLDYIKTGYVGGTSR